MELIPSNTKIDFLSKRYIAYAISAIVICLSVYIWIERGESKFGIDYLGGHELVVKVPSSADAEKLRKQLALDNIDAVVQAFESASAEYAIRLSSEASSGEVKERVLKALEKLYPNDQVQVLKADYVGPTIGSELKRSALMAILLSLVGMLVYITFRFEMAFAVGAVAALFHDVIVTLGVYLWCGNTIGVATLAAALTIVGYSINDTIIIFDRIREEILRRQNYDVPTVVNEAINSTLSRTVITSLLTLFSALALLLYGGGAIVDLSLFLTVGIITGTYSTIFIASPVALAWESFRSKS